MGKVLQGPTGWPVNKDPQRELTISDLVTAMQRESGDDRLVVAAMTDVLSRGLVRAALPVKRNQASRS